MTLFLKVSYNLYMKCLNYIYKDLSPTTIYKNNSLYDSSGRILLPNKIKDFISYNNFVHNSDAIALPCGKCKNCLYNRYNKWVNRLILHSKTIQNENGFIYFITLTYNDSNYDFNNLNKTLLTEPQKMFKRIRKNNKDLKISYFITTEVGSKTGRLHHHLILFSNKDFLVPDPCSFKKYKKHTYFTSKKLTWKNGYSSIAKVPFSTCDNAIRYTIKYIIKNPLNYSYSRCLGYETIEKLTNSLDSSTYILKGRVYIKPNKRSSSSYQQKIDQNKYNYFYNQSSQNLRDEFFDYEPLVPK